MEKQNDFKCATRCRVRVTRFFVLRVNYFTSPYRDAEL